MIDDVFRGCSGKSYPELDLIGLRVRQLSFLRLYPKKMNCFDRYR